LSVRARVETISFLGNRLWSTLPNIIKQASTLSIFKSHIKGHYHPKKLFLHRTRYRPKTWLVCRFWHAEEDSDEIFWVWPSVSMETVKQWDFGSCLVEHPIFEPPSLWLYFCHKMFPIMQNYGLIYFFSFKVALFMKKW